MKLIRPQLGLQSMFFLFVTVLGGAGARAQSTPGCIPVDGLTFELTSAEHILARKGETSVAMIRTHMFLPAGLSSMRFFAGELCPSGVKANFQVNGLVYAVAEIRRIEGDGRRRNAQVDQSGQSATVPQ